MNAYRKKYDNSNVCSFVVLIGKVICCMDVVVDASKFGGTVLGATDSVD